MKIVFNKLQTSKETIQVSLDGGSTYTPYVVSEIIETGIPLDENQEYDKIHIKGSATVLKNLDVVKSIEIPESNNTKDEMFTHDGTSFYGNLVNVKIPEGFTTIGQFAFYQCTSLTSITLPEGLTSISQYAFNGCKGLTSITLPKGLTSIGGSAFSSCSSLTSIDLPENLTSIGNDAFNGCKGLTSITLPKGLTSIGVNAFYGCSNLTSITIPDSVTSIGYYTFYGCKGLTSITLPKGLTFIGNDAFNGCTSLKTINFKGTEDQWNAITKGSNWDSNCHSDMVINFDYQGE